MWVFLSAAMFVCAKSFIEYHKAPIGTEISFRRYEEFGEKPILEICPMGPFGENKEMASYSGSKQRKKQNNTETNNEDSQSKETCNRKDYIELMKGICGINGTNGGNKGPSVNTSSSYFFLSKKMGVGLRAQKTCYLRKKGRDQAKKT